MVLNSDFKSILHFWLIIFLGGIAPLVYTTSFSPHQELPPYRLAIFDSAPRPLPPEVMALLGKQPAAPDPTSAISYERTSPPIAQLLYSQLSQGDIRLTIFNPLYLSATAAILTTFLLAQSIYLPPPNKPPTGD